MKTLLTVVVGLALMACGPSSKDVKEAKSSLYTCEDQAVAKAIEDQMRETFGGIAAFDDTTLVFVSASRWHSAAGVPKQKGPAYVGPGDLSFSIGLKLRKVERGWSINALPMVASHVVGSPRGKELAREDADWPAWADEKTDVFVVKLHQRMKHCAVPIDAPG